MNMESKDFQRWRNDFLSLEPQRKTRNYLIDPGRQLRLPAYLLVATLGFATLWQHYAVTAIGEIYAAMEASVPGYLQVMIESQLRDLGVLTALIALVYTGVLLSISVICSHQYAGPAVALRRQIEALKNGDYSSRVRLRRRDAFVELAEDLNELARILEHEDKRQ
jgi:methyl-accepting chemotaxis protein